MTDPKPLTPGPYIVQLNAAQAAIASRIRAGESVGAFEASAVLAAISAATPVAEGPAQAWRCHACGAPVAARCVNCGAVSCRSPAPPPAGVSAVSPATDPAVTPPPDLAADVRRLRAFRAAIQRAADDPEDSICAIRIRSALAALDTS